MKTRKSLQLLLVAGFGILCALPAMARMDGGPAASEDKNMVIYLGNVEVRGQNKITQTLQGIKVALAMPYSNDPKLADMMVCRLEDKAGSHVQQILICGTNRLLSQQRASIQSAFTAAAAQNNGTLGTSCMTAGCYQAVFDALNDVIDRTSGHFLRTTVDGTALRSLLQQVPTPAPEEATAEATPAAATKQ
ncbi:MAG: hypothetical protein ACHQAZ_04865 [Gammaproteobacteria bacterium]